MFLNGYRKTIGNQKEKASVEVNDDGDISKILDKEENITIIGGSKYSYISESLDLTDNADNSYSCSSNSSDNKENPAKLLSDRVIDSTGESLIHEFGDSSFDDTSFSRDERLGSYKIADRIERLINFEKVVINVMKDVEDNFTNRSSSKESFTGDESENNSTDCSSHSIVLSDNIESPEKSQIPSLCQHWNSTRESFTRDWVNSFLSYCDSYNSEKECAFIESVIEFDDDVSFEQDSIEDSFSSRDCSIKSSAECESNSSGSSIIFFEAVTEENCDILPSLSTRGSLINLEDNEFSSIEDVEIMYSRTGEMCSDWKDIVKAGSEFSFSQGSMNDGFIIEDIFEPPACSKVLQDVNEKWKISMAGVKDTPRDPVKISFAPSSSLVAVHHYEKFEEEDQSYDFNALDKLRFQQRINDFNVLISPFLTVEHRTNVFLRNMYI